MAHILIFPAAITVGETGMVISGEARVSPDSSAIPWSAEVAWTASVPTVNAAPIAAAIAAAEAADYTIGPLDNRTLVAGAVGL